VTGNVVYDRIKYNDQFVCRLFPSTLDVLFALGNNAAAQLLAPQLNEYYYATNLTALRYLVDSYDAGFWTSSIYNMWLHSIRTLNPPADRRDLPPFMQTAAWWQEKMNTQLSSWTELRHDNILYAKQSYTAWVSCSYPCGYVEPVPELYHSLNILAKEALARFSSLSFSQEQLKTGILNYFTILQGVTDTLQTIAEKELSNQALDEHETSFIKSIIFHEEGYAGGVVDGWYMDLLYGMNSNYQLSHLTEKDYLVADYHTTPSDCGGNETGWILHAGTGPVDLAIITANLADGRTVAFAGPVMSYYEYTTTGWQRLTDQEWVGEGDCETMFTGEVCEASFKALALASRPEWVNLYLADRKGHSRALGSILSTAVAENREAENQLPTSYFLAQNYPNPFNSRTRIEFNLASDGYVTLAIHNLSGQQVARLVAERLPAGKYKYGWDAKGMASGVYICKLVTDTNTMTRKMLLLR